MKSLVKKPLNLKKDLLNGVNEIKSKDDDKFSSTEKTEASDDKTSSLTSFEGNPSTKEWLSA